MVLKKSQEMWDCVSCCSLIRKCDVQTGAVESKSRANQEQIGRRKKERKKKKGEKNRWYHW